MAPKKPLIVSGGNVQQIAATDTIDPVTLPTRIVGALQLYTGTTGASVGFLDDYDGKWVYTTSDTIRTIGNASSGAAIAATWTAILFAHIWTQYSNTQAPLLTMLGSPMIRGVSAAADYATNARLTLPDYRGRVIAGAGTGSGLSARTLHTQTGEETHTQTSGELPSHVHASTGGIRKFQVTGTGTSPWIVDGAALSATETWNTASTGSGNGFNVLQPTAFEHLLMAAGAR